MLKFNTDSIKKVTRDAKTSELGSEFIYTLYNAKEKLVKIGISANISNRVKKYNEDYWVLIEYVEFINCSRKFILEEEKKLKELLKLHKKDGNSREYFKYNKEVEDILNSYFNSDDKIEEEIPRYSNYLAIKNSIHEESYKNAEVIVKALKETDYIYLTKETQSGKTSDMLATMVMLNEDNKFNRFLVYSALGQNSLLKQTEDRMVKKVYDDGEIVNLAKVVHNKNILGQRNLLYKNMNSKGILYIFVDECHIAMSIGNVFHKYIIDLTNEFQNLKVKYIFISATGFNMEALKTVSTLQYTEIKKLKIKSPPNYKGVEYFHNNKMLYNIDSKITNNSEVVNTTFLKHYNKIKTGYHIIRCHNKEAKVLENYFKDKGAVVLKLDQKNPLNLKILNIKPKKPTIILVKQMLKAGDTLESKEHIASVWDNPNSVSNLLQGLLGRLTGINTTYSKSLKIFTSVSECVNYIKINNGESDLTSFERNNLGTNVQLRSNRTSNGRINPEDVVHTKTLLTNDKNTLDKIKKMSKKNRDFYFKTNFNLDIEGYKVYSETNTKVNSKRFELYMEDLDSKFYGFYKNENSYIAFYDNLKSDKFGIYLVKREIRRDKEHTIKNAFNEKKLNKIVLPHIQRIEDEKHTQSNVLEYIN